MENSKLLKPFVNQKVLFKIKKYTYLILWNVVKLYEIRKGKKMRSFANYMIVMFMVMFWEIILL